MFCNVTTLQELDSYGADALAPVVPMASDAWRLTTEPDELAHEIRTLSPSMAIDVLRELARARRKGDGWLYLTQVAQRLGQSPGTISHALAKLGPLVEEKREKGLRYVRATVLEVTLTVERAPREPKTLRLPPS